MKIDNTEIKPTIQLNKTGKIHPNYLADVILIIKWESGEYISISGFGLWISKHGGYNLTVPVKMGFKYCLLEKSLKRKIIQEITDQYEHEKEYEGIPVVEEK